MPYKNPEDHIAHCRRYYRANRERMDAQSLQWRLNNPELHAKSCKNWKDQHPEAVRESGRRTSSTRRARLAQVFIEVVDPKVVYVRDKGICQICDLLVNHDWEVDHIHPLFRGGEHSYANSQLTHGTCNRIKASKIL